MKWLALFTTLSREEKANGISHGIGLLVAVALFPFFLQQRQYREHTLGAVIFLIAMIGVYLTSTLYHTSPEGRLKQLWLKLDCGAIFLFIAASYTAFADEAVRDYPLALALIWGTATVGILLKCLNRLSHPIHSTGYYLLFGWTTLLAALGLATYLSNACIYWVLLGGIFYSIGIIFYLLGSRLRFSHLGWHVLVMVGNGCHCVALLYR